MINDKKRIIKELKKNISKNLNIFDIWLYGSFKDKFSDIDIIIVYKNKPPKINFSKKIKARIFDGSIIYIPETNKFDIFLFENLKIYSIKQQKYIKDKLDKKLRYLRELTSFLERYYERRQKLKLLKKENNGDKIRFLKSIILSYETFYRYCQIKKIKIKKINFLNKYLNLRKKLLKKEKLKLINNFIKELTIFDNKFCKNSINILDKIYKKKDLNFYFKFNNYTNFNYEKDKQNNIPFVLGELYNFYAFQEKKISKRIKDDFLPKKNFSEFNKTMEKYLYKKILFLNKSYTDLKKMNHKSGMYRMSWYL